LFAFCRAQRAFAASEIAFRPAAESTGTIYSFATAGVSGPILRPYTQDRMLRGVTLQRAVSQRL
jgi:hypothetical protein